MKRRALLLALAAAICQTSCHLLVEKPTMEIRRGWEFRRAPEGQWRPATVPGCVHTDLLENRLIDDPFFGANERNLQWIEDEDWEYRTVFDVDRELLACEHVELDFEGLDTYADVYLNDRLLLEADNMFRAWRADCADLLRETGNVLRIHFRSPVSAVSERWNALPRKLPGGPRVLTRKAAYHYGWDWAPRFVTSGIWRPVYLRGWNAARITDLHIEQRSVAEDRALLSAHFTIEAADSQKVSLSVSRGGWKRDGKNVDLVPGVNSVAIDFSIDEPRLWWTNGLGEPYRYYVLGEMRDGSSLVDWAARRVGIRTIELVRERDAEGESFYFKLNGVPVYMKGANYIPQDSFLPRVTAGRYESIVSSAAAAGMNMLRVWGGGVYEDDAFYDLCDAYGILVWQDFQFACAMYPGDDAFLENVEREAVENVVRLRNHPSIALWCGNNEIDEAWRHWGWQRDLRYTEADSAAVWADYDKLFHGLLPGVVAKYGSGAPYVPSSPRYGRAEERSLAEGDAHYWGVWHDGEPFEMFREKIPRFMSEFGFQSFPSWASVARFTELEDERLDSEVMLAHQKHPRGNELIERYRERSYRRPRDFESHLYVSQLLQAEGMKTGIEAQRRAKPRCMGTLYWQLNDCWPAASWSSIDYFNDPKALYYFARNAYREVLVSPVIEKDMLRVYAVSDRPEPVAATALLRLMDFAGNVVWSDSGEVTIRADGSRCFFEADLDHFLRGQPRGGVVFCAELLEGDVLLSRNLLYFVPPKELDLPAYVLACPVEITPAAPGRLGAPAATGGRGANEYTVTLCPDALVKNLYLEVEGRGGVFDDNYFDMLPGDRVTVRFITDETIDDFGERLRMMSLVDTY